MDFLLTSVVYRIVNIVNQVLLKVLLPRAHTVLILIYNYTYAPDVTYSLLFKLERRGS